MEAYEDLYKRIDSMIRYFELDEDYETCGYLMECKRDIMLEHNILPDSNTPNPSV
jgi:hypothetical protein